MHIDRRIFNEIQYVGATFDAHYIYPGNDKELDDYIVVEQAVRQANPMDYDEEPEQYDDRINDIMESYPMLGIIQRDSLLNLALSKWEQQGHQLMLVSLTPGAAVSNGARYFLTNDSNYDLTNDLFQDYSGKSQTEFLMYINKTY